MTRARTLLIPILLCLGCSKNEPAPASSSEAKDAQDAKPVLDATKVSFAMRGNEEDYRKCFMRSIGSRGAVSLQFSVDVEGAVADSRVLWSSIASPLVENCLRERLFEQKFGPQREATMGSWTFVFRLTDPIDEEDREELIERAEEDESSSFEILPDSRGTIDAQHLDEKVQLRYPLYAHCYRDSIRRRGESRGLLRLKLAIDETGRLTKVEDAGSVLPDPFAVDCVAEAFYAIDFPRPQGGPVTIRYGLDFD